MTRWILGPLCFSLLLAFLPQEETAPSYPLPEDVASEDAILKAVYDVISGPAGEKRDWDRMRSLFVPCLLYTSPSPRDKRQSRMPSSA